MKKWIAVLLVAVLALACLTGCGKTEEDNTLKVGMECTYAPYNWTQSDDSNGAVPIQGTSSYANGYDVMWAKLMAESMGKELVIVKTDWDSLVSGVMSGALDMAIAGQSITAERLQQVDFTTPYYYATIATLVKKDSPYASATCVEDLAGATCTSQIGTIWYNTCLPQIPNANILQAQETASAMLTALDSGAIEVVVTDRPTATAALMAYPDFVMLEFGGGEKDFQVSEEEINIGISVKKGTELLDAANKVLSEYTEEDFTRMMNEAIANQPLSQE